jgi:electron transfer flavoprotein beta subunit
MKIVVPIKQVATPDEDFDLADGGRAIEADALEWDLNEWDTFSLEAALEIREADGDEGEVVVVTVGNEEAREGMLTALAMGADRGVHVEHEALEDLDPLAVAKVLAAVVGKESPDLVLCGVQSSDAVNGATGVALAGYLDLPHVAVVRKVEVDAGAGTATVERELEGGVIEHVRAPLPALLTVQTGTNEPRYATLRGIRQASSKPMDVVSIADAGVDDDALAAATGARLVGLAPPEKGEGAEMLDGDAAAIAERIATIIKSKVG